MSEQAFMAAIMTTSAGLGALLLAVMKYAFDRLKRQPLSDDVLLPYGSRSSVIAAIERSISHGKETKKMVEDIQRATQAIKKLSEQADDLHKWHDHQDEDGVFRWYVPKSLERAISGMTSAINQQTAVLTQLVSKLG